MRIFTVIIVGLLLLVSKESACQDKLSMQGYIKDMEIFSFTGANDLSHDRLIHNRLNFRYDPVKNTQVGFELRNRIFSGNTQQDFPNYADLIDVDEGLVDMSFVIVDEPNFILLSQIDRAWVNWSNENWEIRAGRQRINWGLNLVWNSNDIFNAYSIVDFDYEERPGTDAIRVQRYFDGMTSAEVTIKPSEKEDEWIGAGMFRFNKWQYDMQVFAGRWFNDYVVGAGWAGNIRTAGFKGEATYFHPEDNKTDGVLSLSMSADYVFGSGLFGTFGVLYNSNGIDTSLSTGTNLFTNELSAKSLMPTKYSTLVSVSYPFTPIVNGGMLVLYTPIVNSVFLNPSLGYSIDDNWEVAVFGQTFLIETEEWDNLGNGVFLRLKGSF